MKIAILTRETVRRWHGAAATLGPTYRTLMLFCADIEIDTLMLRCAQNAIDTRMLCFAESAERYLSKGRGAGEFVSRLALQTKPRQDGRSDTFAVLPCGPDASVRLICRSTQIAVG